MGILLFLFVVLLFLLFVIWFARGRKYESNESVASSYDSWTNDRLLEELWGEHIHLGYYENKSKKDFRKAKIDFVHNLIIWSGLDKLPKGSRILDIGCGIGGSSRILSRDYGFDVLGITISPKQVNRARRLTPENISCRFEVMDALDLNIKESSFDAVWSVEAGPHMSDKQIYANEMLRVLRPGGILAVADWNRRDFMDRPINNFERLIMQQLLTQWTHSEFSSIRSFRDNLINSPYFSGTLDTDNWTKYTIRSWNESIFEGFRRPLDVLKLGPGSVFKGIREIPTIILMRWAFSKGLMNFGVFRIRE